MCASELLPHEEAERLNDVKFLVQQLYTTLRIEEHQLSKERELIGRLEDLNTQLRPLEKVSLHQHLTVLKYLLLVLQVYCCFSLEPQIIARALTSQPSA